MHPDPAFRTDDRGLLAALIEEVGLGTVFAATADGPRVAHTPLVLTGDGAVQFHLSRGNGLTRHLDGQTVLAVVTGPHGYVSPRWYAQPGQVPTWNYVAVELEGRVRRMEQEGLIGLLETIAMLYEGRIPAGEPWTLDQVDPDNFRKMLGAIVGFEMEIHAWRPTLKLSQNKPVEDRHSAADGLEAAGSPAIAQLMRTLGE
jgi:transcriptional regulator